MNSSSTKLHKDNWQSFDSRTGEFQSVFDFNLILRSIVAEMLFSVHLSPNLVAPELLRRALHTPQASTI